MSCSLETFTSTGFFIGQSVILCGKDEKDLTTLVQEWIDGSIEKIKYSTNAKENYVSYILRSLDEESKQELIAAKKSDKFPPMRHPPDAL